MSKPTFASLLRTAREKAGLSVAALATATGVTRQSIGYMESGRNRPTWTVIQRLADALAVSVEDFRDVAKPAKAKA